MMKMVISPDDLCQGIIHGLKATTLLNDGRTHGQVATMSCHRQQPVCLDQNGMFAPGLLLDIGTLHSEATLGTHKRDNNQTRC